MLDRDAIELRLRAAHLEEQEIRNERMRAELEVYKRANFLVDFDFKGVEPVKAPVETEEKVPHDDPEEPKKQPSIKLGPVRKPRGKPRPERALLSESPGECDNCTHVGVDDVGCYCDKRKIELSAQDKKCKYFDDFREHSDTGGCMADFPAEDAAVKALTEESEKHKDDVGKCRLCLKVLTDKEATHCDDCAKIKEPDQQALPFDAFKDAPEETPAENPPEAAEVQEPVEDPGKLRYNLVEALKILYKRDAASAKAFAAAKGFKNTDEIAVEDLRQYTVEVEAFLAQRGA